MGIFDKIIYPVGEVGVIGCSLVQVHQGKEAEHAEEQDISDYDDTFFIGFDKFCHGAVFLSQAESKPNGIFASKNDNLVYLTN